LQKVIFIYFTDFTFMGENQAQYKQFDIETIFLIDFHIASEGSSRDLASFQSASKSVLTTVLT